MRRCYKCGCKKYDDAILCKECAYKLEQKLKEKKDAQKQKSGKWIDREEYDADRWKCSVCGRTEQYKENYCPNCGAYMVEPQESEE